MQKYKYIFKFINNQGKGKRQKLLPKG